MRLSFLLFLIGSALTEGCVPAKMTSRALQPARPHVVMRSGDTVFARSVVIRAHFPSSKIIVDSQKELDKEAILYAHTDWGHRYYVVNRRMMEQVVAGRINVYGTTSPKMKNHPWKPDSAGIYQVRFNEVKYLQKGTAPVFIKPTDKAVAVMMADNAPALSHIRSAKRCAPGALHPRLLRPYLEWLGLAA